MYVTILYVYLCVRLYVLMYIYTSKAEQFQGVEAPNPPWLCPCDLTS